jgi:hypothetical protein
VVEKIRSGDGRLARLLKANKMDAEILEELFLATLSRLPSEKERDAIRQALADGGSRDEIYRDVFWALVNSKEFSFNH